MEREPLPIAEIAERCERLVRVSPADATIVTWLEGSRHQVVESQRGRRAGSESFRTVILRVRSGRRTGLARAEAGSRGELEGALRQALSVAHAAPISSEWAWPPEERVTADETSLRDPELAALTPAQFQERLKGMAANRVSVRSTWTDSRLLIAASGRPTRRVAFTDIVAELRSGRRPGSGFAAGTARTLARLDLDGLRDRAQALEAKAVTEELPAAGTPAVLAPEAAAALVDSLARELFSGRRFLNGEGPLANPAERRQFPGWFHLADDPTAGDALPFPFDLDGIVRHRRELVRDGELAGPALDLELASRCGRVSTAQGLASDDAFPCHPRLGVGEHDESELLGRADGGIRSDRSKGSAASPAPGCRSRPSRAACAGSVRAASSVRPCRRCSGAAGCSSSGRPSRDWAGSR
ncbi:MAG: metallopeptidase TldD-related protein [Thermoanaerobaculia bacterium]